MPSPSPPPLEQAVDEGSTVPTLLHPSPIEQVELEIRWKSWPLVDRLPHSISAILLLVAVSCGMWWTKDSLVIGLLAGGLVAMTMLGYLLPTHYSVGLLGITATRGRWSRLHRWDDIGCVQFADDTMLLFPLPDPRPVDLLFATTVHCDEQYAMVAAYVRGLGTWDGSPGRARGDPLR